jgi:arylsulfatase A-like enzyme
MESTSPMPDRQPNILVLLSDDHGQWASSAYGASELHTPSMQFLADEGARLDRAYTPCPVCSPARACFWTGRYPSGHGIHDWINERSILDEHPGIGHLPNLAGRFKAAGYQTGAFGKWHCHNPWIKPNGFDHWFVADGTNARYGAQPYCDGHQPGITTDAAVRFLQNRPQNKPFFMYVGYTDTHSPFSGKPRRLENWYRKNGVPSAPVEDFADCHGWTKWPDKTGEQRRDELAAYAAGVCVIDEHLGRLLDELDSLQILDDTLIVYTSDHGHNNGHHGMWLKGNSTTPHNFLDESIFVPCLMRWPGHIEAGLTHDFFMSHCDLHQTLLDAAGLEESDDPYQTGNSHLQELRGMPLVYDGSEPYPDYAYCEYANARMIRSETAKLIRRYPGPNGHFKDEFYDLENDPRETQNVIDVAKHQETITEMDAALTAFFNCVTDPQTDGRDFEKMHPHNGDEPWRRELKPESQAILR